MQLLNLLGSTASISIMRDPHRTQSGRNLESAIHRNLEDLAILYIASVRFIFSIQYVNTIVHEAPASLGEGTCLRTEWIPMRLTSHLTQPRGLYTGVTH